MERIPFNEFIVNLGNIYTAKQTIPTRIALIILFFCMGLNIIYENHFFIRGHRKIWLHKHKALFTALLYFEERPEQMQPSELRKANKLIIEHLLKFQRNPSLSIIVQIN